MVEGAALEMLCGETHPGFESLTLRQKSKSSDLDFFIYAAGHNLHSSTLVTLTSLRLLSRTSFTDINE